MATFPTLSAGVSVHLPWTQETIFANVHNNTRHGWRYSYNERATPLMKWTVEYKLSDADLATLRQFFLDRGGPYEEFDFTDPEGPTNYTKCRFGMEEFEVRHIGPNENSVTVVIEEYV